MENGVMRLVAYRTSGFSLRAFGRMMPFFQTVEAQLLLPYLGYFRVGIKLSERSTFEGRMIAVAKIASHR